MIKISKKSSILFVIITVVYFSFFTDIPVFSQKVLLEQNVQKDTVIPRWGPNRKHFISTFFGIGSFFGKTHDDVKVLYGNSSEFTFGSTYKHRVSQHYAWGFGMTYNLENFRLKPNSALKPSNSPQHEKEKLVFHTLTALLYNRVNFDKRRGNFRGHYLDLGLYGSYYFAVKHYSKDELNGNIIKTYISHIGYTNPFSYGIYGGLGFNKIELYLKYMMSDYFRTSTSYSELPHYSVGIVFDINN